MSIKKETFLFREKCALTFFILKRNIGLAKKSSRGRATL
jgi:hypothetical protein